MTKITMLFEYLENGEKKFRSVDFNGTDEECMKAQEWPSLVTTESGQFRIRQFVEDPATEAWEIFCCQSG